MNLEISNSPHTKTINNKPLDDYPIRVISPSKSVKNSVAESRVAGERVFVKGTVALLFLLITILLPSLARGAPAKGIIIYKSSGRDPDRLAKAAEYSKVERFQRITHYYPAKGGVKIRLSSDRVAEVIGYPNFTTGTFTSEQQISELRTKPAALKALSVKYPRATPLLGALAQEINITLQLFDQGKVLVAGRWTDKAQMAKADAAVKAEAAKATLTVKTPSGGTRAYTGVKVTSQEPDALRIMHSAGSARIPYEYLSETDQKKYGFDPVKAEEYREKQVAGADVTTAGMSKVGALLARVKAKYPSYIELIKSTPLGIKEEKTDNFLTLRVRGFLEKNLVSTASQSTLKKGEIYLVNDSNGIFSKWHRTGNRILVEHPPVWVDLPEPGGFDGVEFHKSMLQCVGIYKGNEDMVTSSGETMSLPVFEAKLFVGPSVAQTELITIKFSDFKNIEATVKAEEHREKQLEMAGVERRVIAVNSNPTRKTLTPLNPDDYPEETSEGMRYLIANLHRINYSLHPNLSPKLKQNGFTLEFRPASVRQGHYVDYTKFKALHIKGDLDQIWQLAKKREQRISNTRKHTRSILSPEWLRMKALTGFSLRLLCKGEPKIVAGMEDKQMKLVGMGVSNEVELIRYGLQEVISKAKWMGSSPREFSRTGSKVMPDNLGYTIDWDFSYGEAYVIPAAVHDYQHEIYPDSAEEYYAAAYEDLNRLNLDLYKLMGLGEITETKAMQRIESTFQNHRTQIIKLFNSR